MRQTVAGTRNQRAYGIATSRHERQCLALHPKGTLALPLHVLTVIDLPEIAETPTKMLHVLDASATSFDRPVRKS